MKPGEYAFRITFVLLLVLHGLSTHVCAQECNFSFASDTVIFCSEAPILSAPEGFGSYLWSTGEETQTIEPLSSGTYELVMTSGSPFQNSHSLSFDGEQRAIAYDLNGSLTPSSLTLSAHFKASLTDGRRMIAVKKSASCSNWDAYSLFLENGRLKARIMIGPCAGGCWCNVPDTEDFIEIDGGEISVDTWYHVAMSWNSATGLLKVFVNGLLVNTFQKNDALVYIDPTEPFIVGASDFNGARNDEFEGLIDNVSIWSEPLSQDVITELVDCPPLSDAPSLLALWRFDEGQGSLSQSEGEVLLELNLESATFSNEIPLEACAGCTVSDDIFILLIQPNELFPETVSGCREEEVVLSALIDGVDVLWPDGTVGDSWQILLEEDETVNVQVADEGSTCSAEIVLEIAEVNAVINVSPVSCAGQADGQAVIEVTGDFPPFEINSLNADFDILEGGSHVVQVMDNANCSHLVPFEIPEPDPLQIEVSIVQPLCSTESGSIGMTVQGGTPDCDLFAPQCYDYDWSQCAEVPNGDGPVQTLLPEGVYCVVVTDGQGCQKELVFQLDTSFACGCTYENAINFNQIALFDDGSCAFEHPADTCPSDLNDDQVVNASDLLMFLVGFGGSCSP